MKLCSVLKISLVCLVTLAALYSTPTNAVTTSVLRKRLSENAQLTNANEALSQAVQELKAENKMSADIDLEQFLRDHHQYVSGLINAQTSSQWGFDFGAIVSGLKDKVVEVAKDNVKQVQDKLQENVDKVKKTVEDAASSTVNQVTETAKKTAEQGLAVANKAVNENLEKVKKAADEGLKKVTGGDSKTDTDDEEEEEAEEPVAAKVSSKSKSTASTITDDSTTKKKKKNKKSSTTTSETKKKSKKSKKAKAAIQLAAQLQQDDAPERVTPLG